MNVGMELCLIRAATQADAAAIGVVHVDCWRSTYAGLMPQALLDGLKSETRKKMWQQILSKPQPGSHVLVANDHHQNVIGFISGGPARNSDLGLDGEVYAIYLLAQFQGQGIGKQLFQKGMASLAAAGFKSMILWVLKDNPACRFYEKMGGIVVGNKTEEFGGTALVEVAYGWRDVPVAKD